MYTESDKRNFLLQCANKQPTQIGKFCTNDKDHHPNRGLYICVPWATDGAPAGCGNLISESGRKCVCERCGRLLRWFCPLCVKDFTYCFRSRHNKKAHPIKVIVGPLQNIPLFADSGSVCAKTVSESMPIVGYEVSEVCSSDVEVIESSAKRRRMNKEEEQVRSMFYSLLNWMESPDFRVNPFSSFSTGIFDPTLEGEFDYMIWAAERGYTQVIEMLVQGGTSVNVQRMGVINPLSSAVTFNNWDTARMLVEAGADVNAGCFGSIFYFVRAIRCRKLEFVQLLLNHGLRVNDKTDEGTTLHYVAHNIFGEEGAALVRQLVSMGACISTYNNEGYTPLHLAAINGNAEVVRALVELGADVDQGLGRRESHCHELLLFLSLVRNCGECANYYCD